VGSGGGALALKAKSCPGAARARLPNAARRREEEHSVGRHRSLLGGAVVARSTRRPRWPAFARALAQRLLL